MNAPALSSTPDAVMRLDEQVRRRIRAVLADPVAGVARLGVAARGGERIAAALERIEQGGRRLDRQVRELVPLVQRLGQTRPRAGWYQRLVGASLEHDLQLAALRRLIETRLEVGLGERQGLRTLLRLLTQETAAADIALAATAVDIEAARFLLGPDATRLRARAGLDQAWLAALRGRLADLEAAHVALETARRRSLPLGRRVDHQIDRFDEVRRLTLQLWHERPRAVRAAIRSTLRPRETPPSTAPLPTTAGAHEDDPSTVGALAALSRAPGHAAGWARPPGGH